MNKPIFRVVQGKNNISANKPIFNIEHITNNTDVNDEEFFPQPDPSQNGDNKNLNQKSIILNTNHTTFTTSSTLTQYEKLNDIKEIIKYVKKETLFSLILYINGLLGLFGIKDKLIFVYDEVVENFNKDFNIKLLNESIENLLTATIGKNGKKSDLNHNIKLIKKIYDKKYDSLIALLKLSFFQVLEHFRRTRYHPELQGFDYYLIRSIEKLEEQNKGKDYISYYMNVLYDYEYIYKDPKDYKKGVLFITINEQ